MVREMLVWYCWGEELSEGGERQEKAWDGIVGLRVEVTTGVMVWDGRGSHHHAGVGWEVVLYWDSHHRGSWRLGDTSPSCRTCGAPHFTVPVLRPGRVPRWKCMLATLGRRGVADG